MDWWSPLVRQQELFWLERGGHLVTGHQWPGNCNTASTKRVTNPMRSLSTKRLRQGLLNEYLQAHPCPRCPRQGSYSMHVAVMAAHRLMSSSHQGGGGLHVHITIFPLDQYASHVSNVPDILKQVGKSFTPALPVSTYRSKDAKQATTILELLRSREHGL
ncbi:hypothetical protein K437DRAFT_34192 [Tilletiaria anomala UBC 951]|uniref:Uncharacterized protein n=1 Tax=Tilletiaria anomala (strain ATCC 24038 / CBS 436.72 / UBC 951) TaxID=1037660 RepID=A0A066WDZ5_TILAU|nr:uncharacterized protein K437DRAFT_34192 [Tilletiaria anomala UBC 951]KDN52177.1 hypothetical protein K437DRAFT_34192 [Tilletiaria anomala UBC 951]